MATLNIPIDDAFLPVAIEKIAIYLRYESEIYDDAPESPTYDTMIPNPISKVETIKRHIYRHLREMYRGGVNMELEAADQAAKDQAEADAEVGIGD